MPSRSTLLEVIHLHSAVAQLGLDLDALMVLVVQRSAELVGADGAAIELLDGPQLVYRAVTGLAESQLGMPVSAHQSLSGRCMAEQRVLLSHDTDRDDRVDRAACTRVGLRSMLVVPLRHGDGVVGVLKVMSRRTRAFEIADGRTLELLSEVVGGAMYWAGRYGSDRLYHRATHDDLTGLANRWLFFDRLRVLLAQGRREAPPVAVLAIDVDGLKPINDTHGHLVGDAALVEFGRRLQAAAREADTVARLGGDEFGVILCGASEPGSLSATIQRLQARLDGDVLARGVPLWLGGSIGGAATPEDGLDAATLLQAADRRMYEAKRQRRGLVAS
ncbi:diguanylate cyclase [Ideonella sp. 4Y11]|uniref:Diguanylate cyclase n=1 Tax=Ideonella aquatica TaxID=2824119 RepID=A0A940YKP8_9BURK|nr:sensor domain-containing diguanylate cyclase [Ideonella aquatica]MBQ0959766.1 diguanylate cyclase [Ideonella aquatica]